MQAALPGSASASETSRVVPSDWNVTVARYGGSAESRHARAAGKTAPNAPWTAPNDGLRGTLQGPPPRLEPGATAAAGTSASSGSAAGEGGTAAMGSGGTAPTGRIPGVGRCPP